MGWEDSSYFNCRDTFYDQGKPPPSLGDEYKQQRKRYREPFVYKDYNYRTSHNDIHPVFRIKKSSSQEDFKEVYRVMILQTHPDKGGDHDKFIEVQAAWDELGFNTSE
tara:strand:- start:1045 stop:1368 length:324 start_codon:yes stop_codon:yes gene_type:complete